MIQRGSEILPERNVSAGIIGRGQQRKHVDQPEGAGSPQPDSGYKREPNRQLPESDEERDGDRMRQHDPLQHRNHERISRTTLQESVDPPLKSAAQGELGAKYLVLPEDQKQTTDSDPQ